MEDNKYYLFNNADNEREEITKQLEELGLVKEDIDEIFDSLINLE